MKYGIENMRYGRDNCEQEKRVYKFAGRRAEERKNNHLSRAQERTISFFYIRHKQIRRPEPTSNENFALTHTHSYVEYIQKKGNSTLIVAKPVINR